MNHKQKESVLQLYQREYGIPPLDVAVVHGGPGGAGEVAPLAQDLSNRGYGVIEPFQTKASLLGQVE